MKDYKMIYSILKPMLDKLLAVFLIIFLSPFFLIICALVLAFLKRPIFFRQQRVGLKEEIFYILKFRTMSDDRNNKGVLLDDKFRLKGFGLFLRNYSLDELPQLLNVLKGDMSFIGPRPLLVEYIPLYSKEQSKRHLVKSGITGLAQINGRNAITWEDKFKLDVQYVQNISFLLDLEIFIKTFTKIIKKEGISSKENITMEKFKGNCEIQK